MFSLISNPLALALRSPRVLIAAGLGVAAAAGIAGYVLTRPQPTPEEIERERRDLIARTGRITDGTILDTLTQDILTQDAPATQDTSMTGITASTASGNQNPEDAPASPPHIIVYNYRIAGVSYECAQDVTNLADHVHGIRTDLPIQVRYELHNPGNSIVVAESWSGLRLIPSHPDPHSTPQPQ